MSDALSLPPRPNLEQYKKLAKDFQHACHSGDAAVHEWSARWAETLVRLHGRAITPEAQSEIASDVQRVERQWRGLKESHPHVSRCTLAGAQFFVARCHGFASWPKLTEHLQALERAGSPVSRFESAVDAIVGGDSERLKTLLRDSPDLVHLRSTREHRSTLLHYVSANGVEDFRQKTPQNIVELARMLLDAGADVNAESDAYGGRSTTLGLTATSYHPEAAGVQAALLDLLLRYGASIDGPDGASTVNACLHNGRGEAAGFLAQRGARLDLEGAAGVGRLDVVKTFFRDDNSLAPPATGQQLIDGFIWACEFGRNSVVEFLLEKGAAVDTKDKRGATGLHWAAYDGNADTVALLLERGAPPDVRDEAYEGTPLGWALYGWTNSARAARSGNYYGAVALLVRAGASLDPQWLETGDQEREGTLRKLRSDPLMQAALRGEMPRQD